MSAVNMPPLAPTATASVVANAAPPPIPRPGAAFVATTAPPQLPRVDVGVVSDAAPPPIIPTPDAATTVAPPPLPRASAVDPLLEAHPAVLDFPAHAGWLVLYGPPYRSDPFKPGELDTEGKFNIRYLEVTANKCLNGYVYHENVTSENGTLERVLRVFRAKDGRTEPIEKSDRIALHHVLKDIEQSLKTFLRPVVEEKLRMKCIEEKIHDINGGESLADVLRSVELAASRDNSDEIQAVKRCKTALSERAFIREAVAKFFADKFYKPVITHNHISTVGSLHSPVLVSLPHTDWTGHYYYQCAVLTIVKMIGKKVTAKCEKARVRKKKRNATEDDTDVPIDLPALIDHPSTIVTPSRGRVQAVRGLMSDATPMERSAPLFQRIEEAIRSPVQSSSSTDTSGNAQAATVETAATTRASVEPQGDEQQAMLGPEPAAMEPALAQEGGDLLNDAVGVDVVDEVEDPPMDDRNESLMVAEDIVETNNPSSEPSLLSKTAHNHDNASARTQATQGDSLLPTAPGETEARQGGCAAVAEGDRDDNEEDLLGVGGPTEDIHEDTREEEKVNTGTGEVRLSGEQLPQKRKKSKDVTAKTCGRKTKKTKGTNNGKATEKPSAARKRVKNTVDCGFDHRNLDSYKTEDDSRYWTSGGEFHGKKCLKCGDPVKAKQGMGFRRCKGFSDCGLVWCANMQCFESNETVAEVMKKLRSVNGNGRTSRRAGRKHWDK